MGGRGHAGGFGDPCAQQAAAQPARPGDFRSQSRRQPRRKRVLFRARSGAAMEAAINNVPAIAISVAHKGRGFRFEQAAKFARDLAQLVLAEGMPQGVLLNVNVPLVWNGGVRFTRQSKKVTRNVLQEGTDPRGRSFFWLLEQEHIEGLDPQKRLRGDFRRSGFDDAASARPHERDFRSIISPTGRLNWKRRLSSVGFSLRGFGFARVCRKPHRLKPTLLNISLALFLGKSDDFGVKLPAQNSILPSVVDLGREICCDLPSAESREWLVTNGIGGYAFGTVAGHQTRCYHGLLVAALEPPLGRVLLLAKLDETVEYGGQRF